MPSKNEFSSDKNEIFDQNCQNLQNDELIITGFDVESLYPSLRDIDVACLVRESILHSKISFEGIDFQKALCYIRIMAGAEIMKSAGLENQIPRWNGKKVESLKVTGSSGKNMEN